MRTTIRLVLSCAFLCSQLVGAWAFIGTDRQRDEEQSTTAMTSPGTGTLFGITRNGAVNMCPLKHTTVNASVSGYVARVSVEQIYENPLKDKIEAVYTFPLPDDSAVDKMTMTIGDREIIGSIKKKEEAKNIYENAKQQGKTAALLEGERPNVFTQSVANVEPGLPVRVKLQYVQLLPFESGKYSFVFPTVVGPRFMPGSPIGESGSGWSPDTTGVRDASRISPPVAPKGMRSGHDISIVVNLSAGMKIGEITSPMHAISVTRSDAESAVVSLQQKNEIPNRDFILNWQVSEDQVRSGYLCHKEGDDGYFALMLVPPTKVLPAQIAPRELVFVVDTSGSMSGQPIAKVRDALSYAVDQLNSRDTFRIIAFANSVRDFADEPLPATAQNKDKAHSYISRLEGTGGTWMAPAVQHACELPAAENRLRIVSLMTDGYIGNDDQIITMVKSLRGKSRWFPFGVGTSVNRHLIDAVANTGGGAPEFVLLGDDGNKVAAKFYKRIAAPVLTDVELKFEGVKVSEVLPPSVSDVWDQRPLYFVGKYRAAGKGFAVLTGFQAGKPYIQRLAITLPATQTANSALPSVWGRAKVSAISEIPALAHSDLGERAITNVALTHHLVTQYTSFVAVEEKTVNEPGKPPRKLVVPVEMPQGVSWKGFEAQGDISGFSGGRAGGIGVSSLSVGNLSSRSSAAGGTVLHSLDLTAAGGGNSISIAGPVLAAGGGSASARGGSLTFDARSAIAANGSVNTSGGGGSGGNSGSMLLNSGSLLSTGWVRSGPSGVYQMTSTPEGSPLPPIPGPDKLDTKLQQAIIDALIDDTYDSASVNIRIRVDAKNQKSIDLKKFGLLNIKTEGGTISGTIKFIMLKALADDADVIALMLG
jgi:Ca-activated chloride channel homolog